MKATRVTHWVWSSMKPWGSYTNWMNWVMVYLAIGTCSCHSFMNSFSVLWRFNKWSVPWEQENRKERKLVLLFRFFVVEDKNKVECNNKKVTWAWNFLVIASSCFSSSLFTVHARSVLPLLAVRGASVDESTNLHVTVNSCGAHLALYYLHSTLKVSASFHISVQLNVKFC